MQTVTLSPKFQVVIPQAIREALGLKAAEEFQRVSYDGRTEVIPVRAMRTVRGFLEGIRGLTDRDEAGRSL